MFGLSKSRLSLSPVGQGHDLLGEGDVQGLDVVVAVDVAAVALPAQGMER